MAIYHLSVTVISRNRGQSVVAAAAYRAGIALRDERYGITHNYSRRRDGAEHSEIMAPAGSPAWSVDRETLWNRVELSELRKDSQLARVVEVSLPVELAAVQCLALLREYIANEFVSKGMIADFSIRRDQARNPHAHILLTLRAAGSSGFGPKQRQWNGKSTLSGWRSAWAERVNEHLAQAGHAVRVDHRTLGAQQIELTPTRRVGYGRRHPRASGDAHDPPGHLTDRIDALRRIANENGEATCADPTVLLRALTHQQSVFTRTNLIHFLQSRTDGAAQFDAAYHAVLECPDLIALPPGRDPSDRFTSRDMLDALKSLMHRVTSMAVRRGHDVAVELQRALCEQIQPAGWERRALGYLLDDADAGAVELPTDAVKANLLRTAAGGWRSGGWRVSGVTVSRSAAIELQTASGIESACLAHCEGEWQEGRGLLTKQDVMLVDGAEMMGLKPLERLVAVADKARAKIVLVGDTLRLRSMGADAPFRRVLLEIGRAELRPAGDG